MIARAIAAAASIAACACAHNAVAPPGDFSPALDRELAAIANDASCPLASLSVVAVRDGNVVYENAWGRRFIDGDGGKAATPATLYRIASISKLATTLGVIIVRSRAADALWGREHRNAGWPRTK